MRKTEKKRDLTRVELEREFLPLGISAALLIIASSLTASLSMKLWLETVLGLLPVACALLPTLKRAGRSIARSKLLSAPLLISLACIGTACMGNFTEAYITAVVFGLAGCFEIFARGKMRREAPYLAHLRPEFARVELDGKMNIVDPARIRPGTVITVMQNELIPLDGIVVDGSSVIDSSPYTGGSEPFEVGVGVEVVSGCVNVGAEIKIRVTELYGNSTLVRTAEAIEHAPHAYGVRERRLARISSLYTPIMLAVAVVFSVTASIITDDWLEWTHRGLIILTLGSVSDILLNVTLGYNAGLSMAAANGIILRGKRELEKLSAAACVVMDKTGTVTEGSFSVTGAEPVGISSADLILLAAAAEHNSSHPIAVCLRRACPVVPDPSRISDVREIPGRGVEATVYGRKVLVGNAALMRSNGIECRYTDRHLSVVHVAAGGIYYGYIIIDDRVKDGAKDAVGQMYSLGIEKAVLLTGDNERTGRAVGRALGVSDVMAELLPEDKVVAIGELMREKHAGRLAFVGDAVSDSKVMAKADIGVAIGAMNARAVSSKAGAFIMSDDILKLPKAIGIAKSAANSAKCSIDLGCVVKLAAILLAAFGSIGMTAAVIADSAAFILCAAISFRIYRSR